MNKLNLTQDEIDALIQTQIEQSANDILLQAQIQNNAEEYKE